MTRLALILAVLVACDPALRVIESHPTPADASSESRRDAAAGDTHDDMTSAPSTVVFVTSQEFPADFGGVAGADALCAAAATAVARHVAEGPDTSRGR